VVIRAGRCEHATQMKAEKLLKVISSP
jgi:hypothetical protein